MATKAKLTYLKGRGLGELVRLTLAAAGVEFEDAFLTETEEMEKLRNDGDLLFMQVPLLEIDGIKLVQSGAIVRYIGDKHGLMGKSPEERVMIDMMFEGARDFFRQGFPGVVFQDTEEKKQKIIENIKSKAKDRYLPIFEKVYGKSTSGFLVGDSLSIADVAWLEVLLWLHEIEPQFAITFPSVAAFTNTISSLPQMSAFLKGPQRQPPPDAEYAATAAKVLGF